MNKIDSEERKVYKLVKVEMDTLKKGDMFCLDDGYCGDGDTECLSHVYRCISNLKICVQAETVSYA